MIGRSTSTTILVAAAESATRAAGGTVEVLPVKNPDILAAADVATRGYLDVIDAIITSGIERNISLKLTQLGLTIDRATQYKRRGAEHDANVADVTQRTKLTSLAHGFSQA